MTYSILITTKNRLEELKHTLLKCNDLIHRIDVETIICDDGSIDGTYDYIKAKFPSLLVLRNTESKGLIYSRNKLLKITTAEYAISIDDDSHFLSERPLEIIKEYFERNPKCGVQAFRIFWGIEAPRNMVTSLKGQRVKGFVGCGHVWRMKTWREIPNYLDWFVFYGEEEFASYQLFKKGWEVHYVPEILVQHRVELKHRKTHKDYTLRLRRSLRSGWYNYMLFLPWSKIPRRFLYTVFMQFKLKVFKGDSRALIAVIQALLDLMCNLPKLLKNSNRLTEIEFENFQNLEKTKIYWQENTK